MKYSKCICVYAKPIPTLILSAWTKEPCGFIVILYKRQDINILISHIYNYIDTILYYRCFN